MTRNIRKSHSAENKQANRVAPSSAKDKLICFLLTGTTVCKWYTKGKYHCARPSPTLSLRIAKYRTYHPQSTPTPFPPPHTHTDWPSRVQIFKLVETFLPISQQWELFWSQTECEIRVQRNFVHITFDLQSFKWNSEKPYCFFHSLSFASSFESRSKHSSMS